MENIGYLINSCMDGMQNEFIVYGHSISWWQVYVFIIAGSILALLIGGFFSGS